MIAAIDASTGRLKDEDWEVCNKVVIVNGDPCSLLGLMYKETKNCRQILTTASANGTSATSHDPLYTGPESTFEVFNNLYFWRKMREENP